MSDRQGGLTMQRRSFLARCAAALAGLFCAGRTPAVTPRAIHDGAHAERRPDEFPELAVVEVVDTCGLSAVGRLVGFNPATFVWDGLKLPRCLLRSANGVPLTEGVRYIARLKVKPTEESPIPGYECEVSAALTPPVESA